MVRGHLFRQNIVSAVAGLLLRCRECSEPEQVSMEDTAVRDVAPRMSCEVLAAAAW